MILRLIIARLIIFQLLRNLARMDPTHDDHRQEYDARVEGIEEFLVRNDVAVVALNVLHKADERANKDEDAYGVQAVEVFSPWTRRMFLGRTTLETKLE